MTGPLPLSTAVAHRDAARRHRKAAREETTTVRRCREWMLAHQRVLAVRVLRAQFPRTSR